jgi:hypothetical protein
VVKATAHRAVLLALSCAALSACDSKKSAPPAASGTARAASSGQHSDPDADSSGHGPGLRRPAGPPSIALNAQVRADLTAISVSAHVGSVVIRKEGGSWVMGGPSGCSVPLPRIERALDSLARLHAVPTSEPVPDGMDYQLQITLLTGDERAVQMDVAARNDDGDLVRLDNDSMVRVQGLDRGLWSPHPPDWCPRP